MYCPYCGSDNVEFQWNKPSGEWRACNSCGENWFVSTNDLVNEYTKKLKKDSENE
jgi:transposase-like protein